MLTAGITGAAIGLGLNVVAGMSNGQWRQLSAAPCRGWWAADWAASPAAVSAMLSLTATACPAPSAG